MSSETTGYEILDQYRHISSKLKKRFLRKPNETEALESFTALGQQCESQDLPEYAAINWIAAARCEGTLGNTIGETSYLLRAARQFLKAEKQDVDIGGIRVPTDNLQASLACYSHASSRYAEDSSIPLGLELEIIDFLQLIDRKECTQMYLNNAIELSKHKRDSHVHCLDLLASHFVSIGDYVPALYTYQKICLLLESLSANGHRCELLLKCEVYSVFLLLILRPSPQNISPELAKVLEKYTWGDQNDPSLQACKMSEKLFLLMQSIVIICQSLDTSNLQEIESDFWPYLDTQQKDLLRTLVKIYYP